MHESECSDSAVFTAEVGLSRDEYVRHVLGTARETLARSRGNDQFRERAEPLGLFLSGGRGNVLLLLATAHHQHQYGNQLRHLPRLKSAQHHSLMPRPGSRNARRFSKPSAVCASGAKS
jgi:hypothetical protein